MKIPDSPAVGQIMPLKAPSAAKDLLQSRASAGGLSVHAVVSAHDRFHMPFLHTCLKSRKISLLQIFGRDDGIEFVAQRLRSGMRAEMLGARGCFHHRSVPL